MPSTVYGVKVPSPPDSVDYYWLSNNRMAIRTYVYGHKSASEDWIHEVSLEDLQEYEENQGISTSIFLVKSDYEIFDVSETEKIHTPFKHFHTAENAWKHFHED